MTNIILFDGEVRDHLLPLTFTRPVADLRVGILTIKEKWERRLRVSASFLTQDYLQPLFPLEYGENNLLINGSLLPAPELIVRFRSLETGEAYTYQDELLAVRLDAAAMKALVSGGEFGHFEAFEIEEGVELKKIRRPADLFAENAAEIRRDFDLLTAGLFSEELSPTNTLIGPKENLFIAPGAEVEASILNVQNGPIYIGADAKILEGCLLRGPIALHERAVLKMGAKVYGGTTLGPVCKVGGEINNVIFHSNSNKGHDGYLGNSVIGQWCNIGADTNCSNLKNDYSEVKVWSYPENRFAKSGRQFHGLIMGDHSKAGINTMFNIKHGI
ncbi:MAG: putative sugar nucleotidyl transferase, partial [Bacteroidota bacterium]